MELMSAVEVRIDTTCFRNHWPMLTLDVADLPQPSLPLVNHLRTAKIPVTPEEQDQQQQQSRSSRHVPPEPSPPKSRRLRKDSLENLDADPWGSPALHRGHTHAVENEETPSTNGATAARPLRSGLGGSTRTTSIFTTNEADQSSATLGDVDQSSRPQTDGSGAGWDAFGNTADGFSSTGPPGIGGEGFGSSRGEQAIRPGSAIGRSIGGARTASRGADETVTVTLLPEKEGMFLFQHRNYEVKCTRRASSVVRRYSDFVWLLDCLHKRYPFRQLPLLPPKRVAGEIFVPCLHDIR